MCPIINEAPRACSVLEWACEKMDERYDLLAEAGVRNIKGYNSLTQEELIRALQSRIAGRRSEDPQEAPVCRDHHR